MTIAEKITTIMNLLTEEQLATVLETEKDGTEDTVETFLLDRKSKAEKKGSSKPKALSEDKKEVRDEILRVLGEATAPMSISDMREVSEILAPLNSSKISGNLTPMVRNGKRENPDGAIIRSMNGKTAVFALAE